MTDREWTFTSTIEHPDGSSVYVNITAKDRPDVQELAEVAQMAASHGSNVLSRTLRPLDKTKSPF